MENKPETISYMHKLYAYVITWLFIILSYIVYKVLNGSDIKSVEVILIALFGMINLLLGYMWGASNSGARKDAAIQSLASNQNTGSTEIRVANVETVNTTTQEPKPEDANTSNG